MAVRHFDGVDDVIVTSAGDLGPLDGGPITIAVIWRASSVHAGSLIHPHNAGGLGFGNGVWGLNPYSDNNVYFSTDEGGVGFSVPATYSPNEWYLTAVTKGDSVAQSRGHRYVYSTDTWNHSDTGAPFGDSTRNPIDTVTIGRHLLANEHLNGDLAVIGVWGSVLADVDLEGLTENLGDWIAAGPSALWAFNQGSIAEPVLDLTSGNADQISIVGTTVLEGDDPPGFVYSTPVILFTPPLAEGVLMYDPAKVQTDGAHALWKHYGSWAMGLTVWKDQLGVWHESLYPFQGGGVHRVFRNGVLISSTGPDEGLATAQRVYEGGHVHPITPDEAAELVAAGYEDNIETP